MRFPLLSVALLFMALVGCRDKDRIADSTTAPTHLELSWRDALGQISLEDGEIKYPEAPEDAIRVPTKVKEVILPRFNSPSIAGERATVKFSVEAGSVPELPSCAEVRLTFDSYVNPFPIGEAFTLLFLPSGEFWGILELPSN